MTPASAKLAGLLCSACDWTMSRCRDELGRGRWIECTNQQCAHYGLRYAEPLVALSLWPVPGSADAPPAAAPSPAEDAT